MKKDNLTWGDALVYLEMFARDYSPSPFSYDDIVHIGETTCHHKFTQFDNAENFFKTKIKWVNNYDDDNCAFNIPLNTCFEDCGCFLAAELSHEGSKPHLFMDNIYIDIKDDINIAFDENVEYIKTVAKTSQWIHTKIGSFCKGNPIVISETSDSYLVAHFDHDVKLSWFMRVDKLSFDSREQFETEYFNFAKNRFDNNGYPYRYVQLPDPEGHYTF